MSKIPIGSRVPLERLSSFAAMAIAVLSVACVVACATLDRLPPVAAADTSRALPLGLANLRFTIDQIDEMSAEGERALERQRQTLGLAPEAALPPAHFLAVSGGGDDGAFGAGLLVGWTDAGSRPQFEVVTGISTGALIAPFAFLGPQYDPQLRHFYTTISTSDVLVSRGIIGGLFSDAFSNTTPLWELISRTVDAPMMEAIAREYRKGRLLLIDTTNLDTEQPNIWNIGAIAASGHPGALDLIRKILRASSAVPGAFQPVMIDIMLDGKHYQELHVDGGAVAQMFLYPPNLHITRFADRERHAYLIRNAREANQPEIVKRHTISISERAISTLLRSSGANDLARIYFVTQRDGVDYNLAYIDKDFTPVHPKEDFDRAYMNALFDYGYQQARRGYDWRKGPPLLMDPQQKLEASRSRLDAASAN